MCIVICESVIVKFSDWQVIMIGASGIGGGGRWADRHMGPGAQ